MDCLMIRGPAPAAGLARVREGFVIREDLILTQKKSLCPMIDVLSTHELQFIAHSYCTYRRSAQEILSKFIRVA